MLSYRVTLDVPVQLVLFVSRLLADRRREIGTRRGTRALTCFKQAVFVLAWFRDRPDIRRLGMGFGYLPGHRLPVPARGLLQLKRSPGGCFEAI